MIPDQHNNIFFAISSKQQILTTDKMVPATVS